MSWDLASEFECKCGMEGWIGEGDVTQPCPRCGRVYRGEKQLDKRGVTEIVAVVVNEDESKT